MKEYIPIEYLEEKAKIFPWEYKQILHSIIMNAPTISVKEDNEEFGKLPDDTI